MEARVDALILAAADLDAARCGDDSRTTALSGVPPPPTATPPPPLTAATGPIGTTCSAVIVSVVDTTATATPAAATAATAAVAAAAFVPRAGEFRVTLPLISPAITQEVSIYRTMCSLPYRLVLRLVLPAYQTQEVLTAASTQSAR